MDHANNIPIGVYTNIRDKIYAKMYKCHLTFPFFTAQILKLRWQ